MVIRDNFLKQEEFDKIQKLMVGPLSAPINNNFPWFYADRIVSYDPITFQFVHMFYDMHQPYQFMNELTPIMKIINPFSVIRIKANLQPATSEIIESEFHVDINNLVEEKTKQWTTAILYMNTNNGYTEFQDGKNAMENTKVESVANRMVTFPANLMHRGTSCTDEKTRIVINFNYYNY